MGQFVGVGIVYCVILAVAYMPYAFVQRRRRRETTSDGILRLMVLSLICTMLIAFS